LPVWLARCVPTTPQRWIEPPVGSEVQVDLGAGPPGAALVRASRGDWSRPLDARTVREYFRSMSLTNPYGDSEIIDPKAMRALAHPTRLAALSHLQRHGPATATQVAEVVGASPSVTSWHLRHLASFGLVKDWAGGTDARQRWWQAAAPGFRVHLPAGDEGRAAYQALGSELINAGLDQARAWLVEVAPHLDDRWMAQSEGASTRLMVTPEELGELRGRIEELLAPFLASTRDPQPGAQGVRMLRFCLPEAEASP
jgi:DNA-binding transcriptional ArsR family regulator